VVEIAHVVFLELFEAFLGEIAVIVVERLRSLVILSQDASSLIRVRKPIFLRQIQLSFPLSLNYTLRLLKISRPVKVRISLAQRLLSILFVPGLELLERFEYRSRGRSNPAWPIAGRVDLIRLSFGRIGSIVPVLC
jgi:hypothetical protein